MELDYSVQSKFAFYVVVDEEAMINNICDASVQYI